MGLRYHFNKARKTLNHLAPEERPVLEEICQDIQQAEKDLLRAAESALTKCRSACRGICCRNVDLDAVLD